MADWYVSSAAYTGYAVWQATHAYSIGDIIRPTAPALKAKYTYRCTTAGTSGGTEPVSWGANNGSTTASGTATFTHITGQSGFDWSAAAGDLATMYTGALRLTSGDRLFLSSDHTETQTASTTYGATSAFSPGFGVLQFLSVTRAGSVPPVHADLTPGATIIVSSGGQLTFETGIETYHYGITYSVSGAANISIASFGNKALYFLACNLYLNTSNATSKITTNNPMSITLDNTTVQFGNAGHTITSSSYSIDWFWYNTATAVLGTAPTILFTGAANSEPYLAITARGVDLSAVTGTLCGPGGTGAGLKCLLDSCKIASGATRLATGGTNTRDLVELIGCYDGTHYISEAYQPCGAVTTEFTIYLSGGAQDNVSAFAHKMVSNANIDKFVQPLAGFWMDVNNTVTTSQTATVEIISSGSLNTDDVYLVLEYPGSTTAVVTSTFAGALATGSAVTTSTATWNSSPATPAKQKLQATFTASTAGRVRAQVRLGKASTTLYYDPKLTIA